MKNDFTGIAYLQTEHPMLLVGLELSLEKPEDGALPWEMGAAMSLVEVAGWSCKEEASRESREEM